MSYLLKKTLRQCHLVSHPTLRVFTATVGTVASLEPIAQKMSEVGERLKFAMETQATLSTLLARARTRAKLLYGNGTLPKPKADASKVELLKAMGFSAASCQKALLLNRCARCSESSGKICFFSFFFFENTLTNDLRKTVSMSKRSPINYDRPTLCFRRVVEGDGILDGFVQKGVGLESVRKSF